MRVAYNTLGLDPRRQPVEGLRKNEDNSDETPISKPWTSGTQACWSSKKNLLLRVDCRGQDVSQAAVGFTSRTARAGVNSYDFHAELAYPTSDPCGSRGLDGFLGQN